MAIAIACQSCKRRIRVPSDLAGRRVTCPKCLAVVEVPELPPPETAPAAAPEPEAPTSRAPLPEPTSTSDQLGFLSLALALLSILVFCFPYLGTIFSGIGLLLGLWGLLHHAFVRFFGNSGSAGTLRYPLAGVTACVMTLGMALWPILRLVLFS